MSSPLITMYKEVVVVIGRVDMVDKVFLWLDLCVSPVVVIVDRCGWSREIIGVSPQRGRFIHRIGSFSRILCKSSTGYQHRREITQWRCFVVLINIFIHMSYPQLWVLWGWKVPVWILVSTVAWCHRELHWSWLRLNSTGEVSDLVIEAAFFRHKSTDLTISVHYSCVISAAKSLPNLRQG